MFIDTHCHLSPMVQKKFDEHITSNFFQQIQIIIDAARAAGVTDLINIGSSLIESTNSIAIARTFEHVYATVGVHPCDARDNWRQELEELRGYLQRKTENKIVGIGETGLDFYHKPYDRKRQEDVFRAHIELAIEYDCALVVHVRDAADEVLAILEHYKKDLSRVVIHCFCQNKDFAQTVLAWGFYIGLGAYITYPKNNELREVISQVPVSRLLLETDAPFLPPQQLRGKQNSPAYIALFAPVVADVLGISVEQLGQVTTQNAKKVFGIL